MTSGIRASRSAVRSVSGSGARPALGTMPEWDLSDLYSDPKSPKVAADLEEARRRAKGLKDRYQGKIAGLGRDGVTLGRAVADYESLSDLIGRLGSYAGLLYAADTADPDRAKFYGDIQEQITVISSDLLFFELELNKIEDADMAAALQVPALAKYKPWIDDLRKEKPYQLDETLEKLFLEKAMTSRSAFDRLFNETMTGLRFEVAGEPAPLPLESTLNFLVNPDRSRRKAGGEALAKVFKDNIRLFTLITNTLAKDKEISDRWRGFEDVAAARHLSNRVEPEVVDALVEAVRAAYPQLSHRYYALKAKWFGRKKLAHWDRNAPLPRVPQRTIPWSDARETVITAYAAFSPRLAEIADRFFQRNWIDAPVRSGKQPGAFAHPTVPSAHPYVLLNYQGKPRDVMTLAHELGHGVHQVLAAPNGALMAPTPLTLAETASVFGEMLTFRKLLANTTDKKQRKSMLAAKVEDMINTVVRQIAFYSFERKVHMERRNGELTSEKLNELWMSVQSESLGPAIELKPGYETFWAYIPHFVHSPFYVYAYAFGDCLVNSLYAVYEQSAEGFAERYLEMLSAGGTKHHSELLKPFGLDAKDPNFWAGGLSVISNLIDELERLEASK